MSYRLIDSGKQIYVRKDSEESLLKIRHIIFDFDGVLSQTSQSYRQTIRNVVDHYFLELLRIKGIRGKLVTLQDIQKFKDTGLFNNDWKLSYTLVLYYMNLILRKLEQNNVLQIFKSQFKDIKFLDIESFIIDLRKVGEFLRANNINGTDLANLKDDKIVGLDIFLAQTSLEKPKPIETSLIGIDQEIVETKQLLIKQLIPYDLEKPDLLKRLFEEIYLGKELYKKVYGKPSFFNFDKSFIDIEEFIPTKETLNLLYNKFGRFRIYSGRPKPQGMYILEKYGFTEYFDENQSIFLGDMLKSETEMETLGKPNPTLFIELIKKTLDYGTGIVYIGDGIADAILIEKTKMKGIENLYFFGVTSSSEDLNKLLKEYHKHRAEAVVTDVNDIPYLFKNLTRKWLN
ncbi:MAG: hypothetical protein P8X91_05630 [Candidatus Bathyarchaeota archaeon]